MQVTRIYESVSVIWLPTLILGASEFIIGFLKRKIKQNVVNSIKCIHHIRHICIRAFYEDLYCCLYTSISLLNLVWWPKRIKSIVHPKYKIAENVFTLRPAKMEISLFLHQVWRNVVLHHLLITGWSAVNGCRQNESPNSWLKHHITPVHQLMSCEANNCVCKKQYIIKMF